ncbi:hypothetical protein INT48_004689 [Thamnidium elegans]|uniref:Uncharacterized protein n=1 Tax=Thamnidium elegans TaxID=101142 RepID=A0A8H7VXP4_9FUNG|nr:hypothetical protein INT48_004689 [Thamnidium elegans]
MNNNNMQSNAYNQQPYNNNTMNNQQSYSNNQQSYSNNQQPYSNNQQPYNSMTDTKIPYTNDMKQSSNTYNKNTVLPDYGASAGGPTPMQKEQQQLLKQQQEARLSGGYPGVVGGTPAEFRGVQGYDAQGNPIIPPFIAQRHQIEQSLGPTCTDGGYHDLRMLLTNSSLLFAVLIIPYCCGYLYL